MVIFHHLWLIPTYHRDKCRTLCITMSPSILMKRWLPKRDNCFACNSMQRTPLAFRFIQNHSGVAHMQNTFAFPFNRRKEGSKFRVFLLLGRFINHFNHLDIGRPYYYLSRNEWNLSASLSNEETPLERRRISSISELNCGVWKEGPGMRGYGKY